ncbi:MAG: hypothetical protein JW934_18040 [Anaerolineae bacterium]|nr:hypothetical protein [Anaerolineae bacterium]
MSESVRRCWAQSKVYRVLLIVALVYTVLRLAIHGVYLGMMLAPSADGESDLPEWTEAEGPMIPADLQIYLNAARHFQQREGLYLQGPLTRLEDHYPYAPIFALFFVPFLSLSPVVVTVVHTLLHIAAYVMLFIWWGRIFRRMGLDRAALALAWTLPLWPVFAAFWGDLGYLNIYLPMALLGTWFIEAVLSERLGWALLWLSIIVQIKPHWAFALAVPLFLGRFRFFFKLAGLAVLVYVIVFGLLVTITGPEYILTQYGEYVQFLGRLSRDFPWRESSAPFLGYNHSVRQVIYYVLGRSPLTRILATAFKVLLLLPLAFAGLHHLLRPVRQPGFEVPRLGLDWAFALYLGAFIWLDMVWEVSLGLVVFVYLLAVVERRGVRALLWGVFMPYVFVDLIQAASFAVWGMSVVAPGPYVLTDPSIYVPVILIAILTFYAVLVGRLWRGAREPVVEVGRDDGTGNVPAFANG